LQSLPYLVGSHVLCGPRICKHIYGYTPTVTGIILFCIQGTHAKSIAFLLLVYFLLNRVIFFITDFYIVASVLDPSLPSVNQTTIREKGTNAAVILAQASSFTGTYAVPATPSIQMSLLPSSHAQVTPSTLS
jgi:hypothetical protein